MTPRIQRLLGSYQPLLDPISQEPLGSGALLEIYLGLRHQPVLRPRSLSLSEAERLAARLGDWLEGELLAHNLSFREAGRRLQQLWDGEVAGARQLVRVLAGQEDYTAKQVVDGWERMAKALLTLLDRQLDIWALADELLAADSPAGEEPAAKASATASGGSAPIKGKAPDTGQASAENAGGGAGAKPGDERTGAAATTTPKGTRGRKTEPSRARSSARRRPGESSP